MALFCQMPNSQMMSLSDPSGFPPDGNRLLLATPVNRTHPARAADLLVDSAAGDSGRLRRELLRALALPVPGQEIGDPPGGMIR